MKKIGLYMLLVVLYSCVKEPVTPPEPESKANVRFVLTENDEDKINTIDILAFRVDLEDETKEYFEYRTQASSIVDGATSTQKEAVANITVGGVNKFRLVVLANARKELDALGEIELSTPKEAIIDRLIVHHTGEWIIDAQNPEYTGFPMWGETKQIRLVSGMDQVGIISMIRMLARVDVAVDPSIYGKFSMKSVRVYNHNTFGYVAPNTDPQFWNGTVVIKPTIPSPNGNTVGPILYDQMSVQNVSIRKAIYLLETAAVSQDQASKALCLVIGGIYNNESSETYYRLDFTETGNPQQYIDILRNYLYNVRITNVDGSGFVTPEDALNNQSVNIIAEVTPWENGGLSDEVIDGNNLFQVNKNNFILPMNQRTTLDIDNKLTIFTTSSDGWSILKIVDENDNATAASWLTLGQQTGEANQKSTVSLLTEENDTEKDRMAYIHIKSGRLMYVIKVLQTTIPELGVLITGTDGNEIDYLLFGSNVGGSVPAQSFNVTWAPRSADVRISTIGVVGTSTFNFGTGDAINPGLISNQNGLISYNIQPSPMTAEEVAANPFLEKAIRVDYTVTNGVSYETKAIFLQQKNFAAIPTLAQDYLMDGSEYFFTMNANAPWEIEVTSDPDNLIAELITTIGGQYEDKRDEKVYFRIKSDPPQKLFTAEAVLTIKSTNAGRPFPDRTFVIKGYTIVPNKRLLTIGSDPNGYGYNFSGTAASNKLITSAINFGTNANSTVKSQGFTIINGGVSPTESQMLNWLITNPVDMVIIGYDNANISTVTADYYAQYLNNGGVLLAFHDRVDNLVSGNLLRAILGSNITLSYATGAGSIYQYTNLDSPVLNGPFGDLRLKQWGEDASTTVRVNGTGLSAVDMLSGDRDISTTGSTGNEGYMTAFKHKTLNFIWVGDGGFNSNNTLNDLILCPFKLDASLVPIPKASYGRGTLKFPVYNSLFTANAITWGIMR